VNVGSKKLLDRSAIIIEAGDGKEDRLRRGSYVALRTEEARQREAERKKKAETASDGGYLPDFLK
jgi:hypothetical protein